MNNIPILSFVLFYLGALSMTLSLTLSTYAIFGLEVCTSYEVRLRAVCENALGDYLTLTIQTECVDGTEEAEAGVIDLTVFPNPFEEQITVDLIS